MNINEKDYADYKGVILNKIEEIIVNNPDNYDNEFKAFLLFTAQMFGNSVDECCFFVTEGNDQGIDFYIKVDKSYQVFQCKFAALENIYSTDKVLTYDDSAVRDIENAYRYLNDASVSTEANDKVKKLRAELLTEKYEDISYNLCVFGQLTPDAEQKFVEFKKSIVNGNERVSVHLYDWKTVVKEVKLQSLFKPEKITLRFKYSQSEKMSTNDFCYFLGYATDFYKAFDTYGWSMFDLNVRAELKTSKINKKIYNSLMHEKTQKNFHHLNNGVLLIADKFEFRSDYIEIDKFQIINGCQTVTSIYKAYKDLVSDVDRINFFDEKCRVQVKVIKKVGSVQDLINQIIISTNNQNKMEARNLVSNTSEQKLIAKRFDSLNPKWFYQRKEEEYKSYCSDNTSSETKFRKSNYQSQGVSPRKIDNEDMMKTWLSFVGCSTEAVLKTADAFDTDKDIYKISFLYKPNEELVRKLPLRDALIPASMDLFDKGTPEAEQYLLAYLIYGLIKEYTLGPKENLDKAKKRGIDSKKLEISQGGGIAQEKLNLYLMGDSEYQANNIINNAKEVFLEMFSVVLCARYGFGLDVAKKLLSSKGLKQLSVNPNFKAYAQELRVNQELQQDNILYKIYEFLKDALKAHYVHFKSAYLNETRRKAFLAGEDFITGFKEKVFEFNESTAEYPYKWKGPNVEFIDSLPDL